MNEALTFFAVLVRYGTLFAIVPILGDRMIPLPIKILSSLAITAALYPALVKTGSINPEAATIWGSTTSTIIYTIALETIFGLALGYCSKLVFDGVQFGANITGNLMGFASASQYDPHQETQTEIIAHLQMTLAMLLFLVMDGHHLFLRAAMDSYKIVGIGSMNMGGMFSKQLIQMTGDTFILGMQLAAPVSVSLFLVNVLYGVMAKNMPQMNILVLSFSISALLGFIILLLTMPEFAAVVTENFGMIYNKLVRVMTVMHGQ
ncbi:MAG: flagellar biosynthetic protein FliR [Xanthomonadaceae bacterium]|nr:flagellar biosynthetic protein FliR [Xanthomonadaceae bacterium]